MLYLAEVKKQTRGFISGFKTELKLLACQHTDQTWSAVPGEEILVSDEIPSMGEGALLILNLGTNRQIQGKAELAGAEVVRQLQKLSRLLEKSKDQQEKIEQWTQSLTYQGEELARRETELEAQLEQLEQMRHEFHNLERQRREMEELQERLQSDQKRLEQDKLSFPGLTDISPQQVESVQSLMQRLVSLEGGTDALTEQLNTALETVESQQAILASYWQQLELHKAEVEQQQREVNEQGENLNIRRQDFQSSQASLEQAKIQLQVQEAILTSKQELLYRVTLDWQRTEDLHEAVANLANQSGDLYVGQKVDLDAIENMPLGELEAIVNNLEAELDKLVKFVNDQEEELTIQCQTVEELQEKINNANDYERLTLETELTEEQERKRMLDRTLGGQRRTLRERQEVFSQHLRILRRRQGIISPEESSAQINLEPIILQLEELQHNAQQEQQELQTEIDHFRNNLQQLQEVIQQQEVEQHRQIEQLEREEQAWQQAALTIAQLRSRINFSEEILQPLQDNLNLIRQKLVTFAQWINPC